MMEEGKIKELVYREIIYCLIKNIPYIFNIIKDMFADMPLGFRSVIVTPFVCFILISILYYKIKK